MKTKTIQTTLPGIVIPPVQTTIKLGTISSEIIRAHKKSVSEQQPDLVISDTDTLRMLLLPRLRELAQTYKIQLPENFNTQR